MEKNLNIESKLSDVLFNYSIARKDIEELAASVAEDSSIGIDMYTYELQILKIISIGVCINYLLQDSEYKADISEKYWQSILEFSDSVTKATMDYSNTPVNYFDVLKKSLDFYVAKLNANQEASEPSSVIGPAFAEKCGNIDDTHAVLLGSKMFNSVASGLKKFLGEEDLI